MQKLATSLVILLTLWADAQIVSGPMPGHVSMRDITLWLEAEKSVKEISIHFQSSVSTERVVTVSLKGNKPFNTLTITLDSLEPGTRYNYTVWADGKSTGIKGSVSTRPLWQWRNPAPDFSFLGGSCAYFNEAQYDRPGNPYGRDSSIFLTMAAENADFMLWLGDNWYTREVDYFSEWGLWYRPHHDRKQPVLQPLLQKMHHFATWDDHDYGPNNSAGSYVFKKESREAFKSYWANPTYGMDGEGIYTRFSWNDADFFLLDDRWWRSSERRKDSVNGRPNPDKIMLGEKQMNWLKDELLYSNAPFKFVICGTQVLNTVSPYDKLLDFPVEYYELMNFLDSNKVSGVIFMSGDRHHTEIIRRERKNNYTLYDITLSALTSGMYPFSGREKDHPDRVLGVDVKQNYGRMSISGERGKRKLTVEIIGIDGKQLAQWSIMESELRAR